MRLYLISISLFVKSNFLLFSQTTTKPLSIEIKYSYSTPNSGVLQYSLQICDSISNWRVIDKSPAANSKMLSINTSSEYYFYKRRKTNSVYYTEFVNKSRFLVRDSLYSMRWKLSDESKDILGFKCNSAKTSFRGRNYIAFYSYDIPIPEGPWKFSGLPGAILEIYSLDKEYKYSAIEINKDLICFNSNDIKLEKSITWTQFKSEFIKSIDKAVKVMKSTDTEDDYGYPTMYKYHRPEIIYPAVQIGEGIKF
jgi:GLPGLI family protein